MKITHFVSTSWLILPLALTTSCTDIIKSAPTNTVAETSYCTTNATFSTSYTIEGNAYYRKRNFTVAGLGAISGNMAIRRAEVQVLNAAGAIVQCTETDASGYYTFDIPDDGGTYTVKVLSRSYNTFNKVSVLGNPTTNIPYSITTTFVADTNKTLANLVAHADTSLDSTLRGGAFNILDQIYLANDYLLNNTSVGAFTVDHKVQAYWTKGINPVTYFGGDPDSGVSFYIPGEDQLYILGGIDGDITTNDTDHFDNSVIIHEYGHFLEDNYSASDSPGGTHYGLFVIDPRLAWSEGFSTYFASRVTGDPIYRDTVGIGGGYGYYYDMENNLNEDNDPQDMPTAGQLGEGGFRELAVSRMLWATTDAPVSMPFSELWDAYVVDFKNTLPFREMSLFLKAQADNAGTNISSLLDDDDKEMTASRAHYGVRDNSGTANVAGAAACRWTIQASAKIPISGNVFDRSNQFYSNDFYYIYHGGGTLSVTLDYDVTGATAVDLDLYIYKDAYSFGVGNDLLTYSNKEKGVGVGEENGFETISISAPAGPYMINVMYYNDGAGSPATVYNIDTAGNLICR